MDPGIIIGIVIVWIACAFGCMTVASRKNKNPVLWFWLGLLLGIIALLIIGFLQAEVNTRSSIYKLKAMGETDALAELIANETDTYICRLAAEVLVELGDERGKKILDSPIRYAEPAQYAIGLRLLATIVVFLITGFVLTVLFYTIPLLWEISYVGALNGSFLPPLIAGYIAYRWVWRNKLFISK
jgi:multisubunit Na+/H+ antiporter MnhB subunit